jgi:hypothetical protein
MSDPYELPSTGERYVVHETHGWGIMSGQLGRYGASVSVLDSANNWREVFVRYHSGGILGIQRRRRHCVREANRLNNLDQETT